MFQVVDIDFISGQLHLCSAWNPEQSESFRGVGQQDRWLVAPVSVSCVISDFKNQYVNCALLFVLVLFLTANLLLLTADN